MGSVDILKVLRERGTETGLPVFNADQWTAKKAKKALPNTL